MGSSWVDSAADVRMDCSLTEAALARQMHGGPDLHTGFTRVLETARFERSHGGAVGPGR